MDQKVQMKKEVSKVFEFDGGIDYTNTDEVSSAIAFFKENNLNKTPVGMKYVSRLQGIVAGTGTADSCVICNLKTEQGMICPACRNKLSSLVGAAPAPKPTPKPVPKPAPEPQPVPEPEPTPEPAPELPKPAAQPVSEPKPPRPSISDLRALRIRDIFSGIFKHHSREESEEIFTCGTSRTTPDIRDISSEWPRPWLFSRVFVVLLAAFYLLLFCWRQFGNPNVLPGIMFIGSCMIPVSILIFYFEMNVPRNISLIEVFRIFLLGGCMSLVVTLILFEVMPDTDFTVGGAILIGIIEEYGKLLIVAWFIKRLKGQRFILNGMLIGAAIGTGFAVFESAGYAFRVYSYLGVDAMLENIYMRGVLSPGSHIAWAAFSGAALVIVMGQNEFKWKYVFDKKFLCMIVVPIGLHALWDMSSVLELGEIGIFPIKQIILAAAMCVVNFILLARGLKEINETGKSS